MTTRLIIEPAVEPVTLAEAKLHCRVDHADEDTLISMLISVAREQCEHILGRSIAMQTWETVLDLFPQYNDIELFNPPIVEITSVKYIDEATGQETTLNANQYVLDKDSEPGWLMPAAGITWPATADVANAVRVRYTAGYASVPKAIKHWILLAVGEWYKSREAMVDNTKMQLPHDFNAGLLDRYRVWRL